mmetsp:Transcript_25521/g.76942  ORF Transcript_25521/g.76942 Transcript_25521/m.76942 type:complete len:214 (-) Transcript_25521:1153-1794(-)
MSHHLRKSPPDGFELIEDELDRFDMEMREAERDPHDGKRKVEALWPIHKIHYQKSRYVYEMYYKKKLIDKKVYDYCIKYKIVDAALIAKWKKQGYETLCSLTAIQTRDTSHGTTNLCRVPLTKRRADAIRPSQTTGCISCCSGDGGPIWWDGQAEADERAAEGKGAKRPAEDAAEAAEAAAIEERAKRLRGDGTSFLPPPGAAAAAAAPAPGV